MHADAAHELLSPDLPSRLTLQRLMRSVNSASLELAAATSECSHVWSLRHDQEGRSSEGSRDALSDVRYRAAVRHRLYRALDEYLSAIRELTREATRGAFLSDSEPAARDHEETIRAYIVASSYKLEIPF